MPRPVLNPSAHRALALGLAAVVLSGCAVMPAPLPADIDVARPDQPEPPSGYDARAGVSARRFLIATANPLATQAGHSMLQAGGGAVDAAIAAQMMLTLVEPQSSGIGGGAFLLHWNGRRVHAYDGRETAPAVADERLFLQADGRPLAFRDAVVGGLSVGTPGVLRMLEMAHRAHGRLPWARLFEPAIARAEQGFAVSPRLHALLLQETDLALDPQARAYFYRADGSPHPAGTLLRNPALAQTLRLIADGGADAFYTGPVAAAIVDKVRGHPQRPGGLGLLDLVNYEARERDALCHHWRPPARVTTYRLCGFPPPSSGHLAVGQILGIVTQRWREALPADPARPGAQWLHVNAEASRLAFADRARYVADPAFTPAPGGDWLSLLDEDYLRGRARLIEARALPTVAPGTPPGVGPSAAAAGLQAPHPESGTSHLSIVDARGRALAMTTTIESAFGARLMVDGGTGLPGGFLLNNQLTDFSFVPADDEGRPIANRVEAGKRPRSSMSPTLVFNAQTSHFLMSLGSPGGALIIHYTAKALMGALGWGLDLQEAVNLPNSGTLGGPVLLEQGRHDDDSVESLRALGHDVRLVPLTSGLQAIQRRDTAWFGAADPRREGLVMGE